MNWKFTLVKVIVSVFLGVLLFWWASPVIGGMFSLFSVIGFLVGFSVVYVIWSLIQKKESVQIE